MTSFSAGNLSPLFTTSVATPTTTHALTFSLTNTAAFTLFGRNAAGSGAPGYISMDTLFGSCSGATNAWGWNTTTHAAICNTISGGGSGPVEKIIVNAGCDVTQHQLVYYSPESAGVCPTNGYSARVDGIAETTVATGNPVTVDVLGVSTCVMSGAVNRGAFLVSAGSGLCSTTGSYSESKSPFTEYLAGKALADASDGDPVSVFLFHPAFRGNGGLATELLLCQDSSGSGTAQSCNTSLAFDPTLGSTILYSTTTTNTGDVTISVNSNPAYHAAKWQGTSTLAAGDLKKNVPMLATFDGSYWELYSIGNAPSGGTPGAAVKKTLTVAAACSVNANQLVHYSSTNGGICAVSGYTEAIDGIAETTVSGGNPVVVDEMGISTCTASGAITQGHFLVDTSTPTAGLCADSGFAYESQIPNTTYLAGQALAAAGDGDPVSIFLFHPAFKGNKPRTPTMDAVLSPVAPVLQTAPLGDTYTFQGTAPGSSAGAGINADTLFTEIAKPGGATTGSATTAGNGGGFSFETGNGGDGSGGTNANGGNAGLFEIALGATGAPSGTGTPGADGAVDLVQGSIDHAFLSVPNAGQIEIDNVQVRLNTYPPAPVPSFGEVWLGNVGVKVKSDTTGNLYLVPASGSQYVYVGNSQKLAFDPYGNVDKLAGTTLAGQGVPGIVYTGTLSGYAAAIGPTTMVTVGASPQLYRFSGEINASAAGSGSTAVLTLNWTDTSSTTQSISVTINDGTLGSASVASLAQNVRALNGTTVTWTVTITGTPTFDVDIRLEQM